MHIETIIITALVTGFLSFWAGYIMKRSQDNTVLIDHEGRIRMVEKAVVTLTAILDEREHGR